MNRSRKAPFVFYGSWKMRGKEERTRVRRDLLRGLEPQPTYTTGKFWVD